MATPHIAFLGPEGTYSHQVARKRFRQGKLTPCASIVDICEFTAARPSRRGLVPIENSSRGTIDKTIDILINDPYDLYIEEEIAMEVTLSLLGRRGNAIQTVYSHYAPLEHCDAWLREHFPGIVRREVASTAAAAQAAAADPHAAAIGRIQSARLYGLDVLKTPIADQVRNVTHFLVIGRKVSALPRASKTSLVVQLADDVGSLCSFLEPFRDFRVNLSRIVSRPILGKFKQYAFFVDIDGTPKQAAVARAIEASRAHCTSIRVVGTYPSHRLYRS